MRKTFRECRWHGIRMIRIVIGFYHRFLPQSTRCSPAKYPRLDSCRFSSILPRNENISKTVSVCTSLIRRWRPSTSAFQSGGDRQSANNYSNFSNSWTRSRRGTAGLQDLRSKSKSNATATAATPTVEPDDEEREGFSSTIIMLFSGVPIPLSILVPQAYRQPKAPTRSPTTPATWSNYRHPPYPRWRQRPESQQGVPFQPS